MTIHYLSRAFDNPKEWPHAKNLKKQLGEIKFFTKKINFSYRSNLRLFIVLYPLLIFHFSRLSYQSIMESHRTTVVLDNDAAVFVYRLIEKFFRKEPTKLIMLGFIYSENKWRKSRFLFSLRHYYFTKCVGLCNNIIVYTNAEAKLYSSLFNTNGEKFLPVLYGIGTSRESENYAKQPRKKYIISAGRSGRDYRTLLSVASSVPYNFKIICDSFPEGLLSMTPQNVEVLRSSHGLDFIDKLISAELVVLPLVPDNVSVGQMVLLQSLAYRKPVIVTKCNGLSEYIAYAGSVKEVPPESEKEMRELIIQLMSDYELRRDIGERNRMAYEDYFTNEHFSKRIASIIKRC